MALESEYDIIETIYESDKSKIYHSKHKLTGKDVILKQGKSAIKSGLYNEYNLIKEQTCVK